jgi:nucleoside phosphorylase
LSKAQPNKASQSRVEQTLKHQHTDKSASTWAQWGGELVFEPAFAQLPQGVCGTGDSCDTGTHAPHCDVLDMEAYALAKVCLHEGVDFACAKYISDGADHSSATDWSAALPAAAAAFASLYRQLAHG